MSLIAENVYMTAESPEMVPVTASWGNG
jgi:hypothetical protein